VSGRVAAADGSFRDVWGLLGRGSIRHAQRAVLLGFTFVVGCTDISDSSPPVRVSAVSVAEDPSLRITDYGCRAGETRECHIVLRVRADTVTCVSGVSECRGGSWSECFRETDPAFED
jgi:hypothetical protein